MQKDRKGFLKQVLPSSGILLILTHFQILCLPCKTTTLSKLQAKKNLCITVETEIMTHLQLFPPEVVAKVRHELVLQLKEDPFPTLEIIHSMVLLDLQDVPDC